MLLDIDFHSGMPIYMQIVGQIRKLIVAGELKEGDRLEAVRDLAARLKVNPMTVSKAYSLLESEGLLERRRGIGLYAAGVGQKQQDKIKADFLNEILKNAAVTAIQLGFSQEQAAALLKEQFVQFRKKGGAQ